jgi:hypothetical protein
VQTFRKCLLAFLLVGGCVFSAWLTVAVRRLATPRQEEPPAEDYGWYEWQLEKINALDGPIKEAKAECDAFDRANSPRSSWGPEHWERRKRVGKKWNSLCQAWHLLAAEYNVHASYKMKEGPLERPDLPVQVGGPPVGAK